MDHDAPYTFVPPSTRVQRVTSKRSAQGAGPSHWPDAPSQDHPYQDGVCGELRIRLVAETPIFVRGVGDKTAPYRAPDGRYALPGSTVRGMLRSVVEIASFSALGPVNDDRHGFRDLQNRALYVDHMAGIHNGTPTPFVTAGWLRRTAGGPYQKLAPEAEVGRIRLCHFAKVEYGLLEAQWRGRRAIGERARAPDRYEAYGVRPGGPLPEITVPVRTQRAHNERVAAARGPARLIPGEFAVSDPASTRRERGKLVVTGQPNNWVPGALKRRSAGNPKHHDFVFYGNAGIDLPVTQRDLDAFEFVHRADQEQHGVRVNPNAEWGFWRGTFDGGAEVPVFVLTRAGPGGAPELRAFGLAMMFRLAYDRTIGDAVANTQPEATETAAELDFASALFGHVENRGRHDRAPRAAIKGRVAFGAVVAPAGTRPADRPIEAVLGTPKVTFYPNYIENGALDPTATVAVPAGARPTGEYATLMDKDVRVRGWKRYRPQDADPAPRLPEKASDRVKTRFAPLPAGTVFDGSVRVHNVRPHELGALLWAIDFGGDAQARHTVGMARSLGYGRCRIEVVGHDLDRNDGAPVDLDAARRAFNDQMEAWAKRAGVHGGWAASLPVLSLQAAARPLPSGRRAAHPQLRNAAGENEFTAAKKARVTLAPPLTYEDWVAILSERGLEAPARGRGGAPPPGGAPSGGSSAARGTQTRPPPPPPPPALSNDPLPVLKRAFLKGQQWALLQQWAKEGDVDKAARVAAARSLLGADLEKKGAKYSEVMDWLKT